MKKIFTILTALILSFATLTQAASASVSGIYQQHTTKSGKPDKRYKENKHLKKDGTADKRYNTNSKTAQKKK